MKTFITAFLLLITSPVFCQDADCKTKEFTITGTIAADKIITSTMLAGLTAMAIPDIIITNHKGEVKRTIKGLKGVLLKDILQQVEIKSSSPKTLSEFYLVFTACDGYKVVYSWNEIFNSATGNNIFIVTQKEGKGIEDIEEGIISVTPTDEKTGRRYVKGLASITVKKAD